MEIANILKDKSIKTTKFQKGAFLRKQWEDSYANHLSLKEKKDIYVVDNEFN